MEKSHQVDCEAGIESARKNALPGAEESFLPAGKGISPDELHETPFLAGECQERGDDEKQDAAVKDEASPDALPVLSVMQQQGIPFLPLSAIPPFPRQRLFQGGERKASSGKNDIGSEGQGRCRLRRTPGLAELVPNGEHDGQKQRQDEEQETV